MTNPLRRVTRHPPRGAAPGRRPRGQGHNRDHLAEVSPRRAEKGRQGTRRSWRTGRGGMELSARASEAERRGWHGAWRGPGSRGRTHSSRASRERGCGPGSGGEGTSSGSLPPQGRLREPARRPRRRGEGPRSPSARIQAAEQPLALEPAPVLLGARPPEGGGERRELGPVGEPLLGTWGVGGL